MIPCSSSSRSSNSKALASVLLMSNNPFTSMLGPSDQNDAQSKLSKELVNTARNTQITQTSESTQVLDLDQNDDALSSLIYKAGGPKSIGHDDGLPDFVKSWKQPAAGGMNSMLAAFTSVLGPADLDEDEGFADDFAEFEDESFPDDIAEECTTSAAPRIKPTGDNEIEQSNEQSISPDNAQSSNIYQETRDQESSSLNK